MKIALVHKRLDLKGGTERDLFETAVGLSTAGHQVHLFCSQYGVPVPPGIIAHPVLEAPSARTASKPIFLRIIPSPRKISRYCIMAWTLIGLIQAMALSIDAPFGVNGIFP